MWISRSILFPIVVIGCIVSNSIIVRLLFIIRSHVLNLFFSYAFQLPVRSGHAAASYSGGFSPAQRFLHVLQPAVRRQVLADARTHRHQCHGPADTLRYTTVSRLISHIQQGNTAFTTLGGMLLSLPILIKPSSKR